MGYECPVCGTPQADGTHLANHLAITAMTHGEEHEEWLDEYTPGWRESSPDDLADQVVAFATETDHETIFEDTAGNDRRFEDELERQLGAERGRQGGRSGETEAALEEARRLTERMLEDEDERE